MDQASPVLELKKLKNKHLEEVANEAADIKTEIKSPEDLWNEFSVVLEDTATKESFNKFLTQETKLEDRKALENQLAQELERKNRFIESTKHTINNNNNNYEEIASKGLIILVHGTWSHGDWYNEVKTALDNIIDVGWIVDCNFRWDGGLSISSRAEASIRLTEYINEKIKFSKDLLIWVIAHSHGGNVALEAICNNATIHKLILLGTPQCKLYIDKFENRKENSNPIIINIFSSADWIQKIGAFFVLPIPGLKGNGRSIISPYTNIEFNHYEELDSNVHCTLYSDNSLSKILVKKNQELSVLQFIVSENIQTCDWKWKDGVVLNEAKLNCILN